MKRASYRDAIYFIAINDSLGDNDALDPEAAGSLTTAVLVSEIFGVESEKVGQDIVNVRKKYFKEKEKKSQLSMV